MSYIHIYQKIYFKLFSLTPTVRHDHHDDHQVKRLRGGDAGASLLLLGVVVEVLVGRRHRPEGTFPPCWGGKRLTHTKSSRCGLGGPCWPCSFFSPPSWCRRHSNHRLGSTFAIYINPVAPGVCSFILLRWRRRIFLFGVVVTILSQVDRIVPRRIYIITPVAPGVYTSPF